MTTDATKEKAWEEMLAEDVPTPDDEVIPPSYSQIGDIVARPTADSPGALRITDLRFKGYVQVWDTKTGDMSLQPKWLLWQTMRKKHEDGTPRFTQTDPKIAPHLGDDLVCPLNPSSPGHKFFKDKGFRPCTRAHIPHEDALWRHVRHSHKRAWDMHQLDIENRQRQEDRDLQQKILAAQVDLAEAMKGHFVPEELVKQVEQIDQLVATQETPLPDMQSGRSVTVHCPQCNKGFTRESVFHAEASLRSHTQHCKNR